MTEFTPWTSMLDTKNNQMQKKLSDVMEKELHAKQVATEVMEDPLWRSIWVSGSPPKAGAWLSLIPVPVHRTHFFCTHERDGGSAELFRVPLPSRKRSARCRCTAVSTKWYSPVTPE
jgi:hypothetical protein